jgi:protein phosphatase
MPRFQLSELTHAGSGHAANEDAVGHWKVADGVVFAVADGIGAAAAGQVASSLALEVFGAELGQMAADVPVINRLRRAVQAANVAVYQKGLAVPELRGMGATLTATAVVGASLVTAHVGDCRLWLFRDRTLTQLTKDHTWVWAHVPGAPPLEHAHGNPRRYSLPRCLGHELVVTVDLLSMDLHAGDVLAQASDGLHGALGEDEIRELLEAHPPDAACHALVRRAREEDDRDDVSVQVIRLEAVAEAPARAWWWRR